MFLGAYHFDGDPDDLRAGYERMLATYPPDVLELNVAVLRADGLTVLDTCPNRSAFEAFSRGPEFAAALAAAGLPTPRLEPLGEVHRALVGTEARSEQAAG